MTVLIGFLVLGGMGAVFGLALAVAAKVFRVETDPREVAIAACLPGANCGGCGFPGCGGYAAAVVAGKAPVNACAAGGAKTADRIAAIMGVKAGFSERSVAAVKCSGVTGVAKKKYDYVGIQDCQAAAIMLGGGPNECAYGCLGFGSCVKACPFGAMSVKNGVAQVDRDKCVACMKCAAACPKDLIVKVPYSAKVTVPCSSPEKGAVLRNFCGVGCIGCKICERTCEHDAIHVEGNLAVIDYNKCTSCGECAAKCPRHLIRDAIRSTDKGVEVVKPARPAAIKQGVRKQN